MKTGFARNVLMIAGGSSVAQAIAVGISPVLTRLYSAEAFGVLGIFLATSTLLGVLSTGRYDLAIVLAKSFSSAKRLLVLAIGLATVFSVVLLCLIPAGAKLAPLYTDQTISAYLMYLPVAVLFTGLSYTFDSWFIRKKKFGLVSFSSVVGSLVYAIFATIGGILGMGPAGLIVGNVLSAALKTVIGCRYSFRDICGGVRIASPGGVSAVARRYSDFPKYKAPNDAINNLSQNAPIWLLLIMFSPIEVGFFWLAVRVLRLPASLLSSAVKKVFLKKSSDQANQNLDLFPAAAKLTFALAVVAAIPVIVIVLYGPPIFEVAFGEEWRAAGEYSVWIAIWVYFLFINVPAVVLAMVMGLQKTMLMIEVASIAARVFTFLVVGLATKSAEHSIAAFCVAAAASNIVLIGYVLSKSRSRRIVGDMKSTR